MTLYLGAKILNNLKQDLKEWANYVKKIGWWTYENVAYGFCFVFYRNNVQANVHTDVLAYDDLTKDEKTIFIKIKKNPKTLKNKLASIIGKS